MPLGISESLIQRAYAPVDLSGFYKGIDEASKRAAAEQKAEKKAAQKDYYNSQAIINKDMGGIKSQDMSEVNGHYSKWKSLQKQLMDTSFEKNPEEYARLNAESNAEYGLTMSKIELSKQKKKEHEAILTHMMQNPTKYKKDAVRRFQGIMLMPTSEAIKINDNGVSNDDISDLQYTGPTVAQQVAFEKQLTGKDIYSEASVLTTSDDKEGFYAGTDVQIADTNKAQNIARTYLSIYGGEEQGKFAQSYIDNNKNNIIEVKKQWEALPDSALAGYKVYDASTKKYIDKFPLHISPITGKETRKTDLFTSDDPIENFISYSVAKSMFANPEKKVRDFSKYNEGSEGKAKFLNKLSTDRSLLLDSVRNEYATVRQQKGFDFRLEELPAMQKLLMNERTINNLNGKVGEGELATWIAANPNADPTAKLEEIKQRGLDIGKGKKTQIPVLPFAPFVPSPVSNVSPSTKTQKKQKVEPTYQGLDNNGKPIFK
jgi:hypothetical protein